MKEFGLCLYLIDMMQIEKEKLKQVTLRFFVAWSTSAWKALHISQADLYNSHISGIMAADVDNLRGK